MELEDGAGVGGDAETVVDAEGDYPDDAVVGIDK